MAVVHHLGSVMRMFEPPTKGIWWSLSLCTICLESMQQFLKYARCNILRPRLEYDYLRPKIVFWGGFDLLNAELYHRDSQKAHPWAERRRLMCRPRS